MLRCTCDKFLCVCNSLQEAKSIPFHSVQFSAVQLSFPVKVSCHFASWYIKLGRQLTKARWWWGVERKKIQKRIKKIDIACCAGSGPQIVAVTQAGNTFCALELLKCISLWLSFSCLLATPTHPHWSRPPTSQHRVGYKFKPFVVLIFFVFFFCIFFCFFVWCGSVWCGVLCCGVVVFPHNPSQILSQHPVQFSHVYALSQSSYTVSGAAFGSCSGSGSDPDPQDCFISRVKRALSVQLGFKWLSAGEIVSLFPLSPLPDHTHRPASCFLLLCTFVSFVRTRCPPFDPLKCSWPACLRLNCACWPCVCLSSAGWCFCSLWFNFKVLSWQLGLIKVFFVSIFLVGFLISQLNLNQNL